MAENDFTDYHCVAINMLGTSSARTELVELRTVSLTDPAKIFTTKVQTTIELIKLNETVIPFSLYQNVDKSSVILSETQSGKYLTKLESFFFHNFQFFLDIKFETSTIKYRNSKGSIHRSNKHNNQSKTPKIHQKQQVQNQQRNFFSTTKFLQIENCSSCWRLNRALSNPCFCIILLLIFKNLLV